MVFCDSIGWLDREHLNFTWKQINLTGLSHMVFDTNARITKKLWTLYCSSTSNVRAMPAIIVVCSIPCFFFCNNLVDPNQDVIENIFDIRQEMQRILAG